MESVIATNVPTPTPDSDSSSFEKPTPTPDSDSTSFKKPTPTPDSDSSSFENRLRLPTPTPAENMRLHRLQTPTPTPQPWFAYITDNTYKVFISMCLYQCNVFISMDLSLQALQTTGKFFFPISESFFELTTIF